MDIVRLQKQLVKAKKELKIKHESLRRIAGLLVGIDKSDLTTAETRIVDVLIRIDYITEDDDGKMSLM